VSHGVRNAGGNRRGRLLDWKAVVGLIIGAAALYFTLRRMDLPQVWHGIQNANPLLLLLSSAAATGVFWIRAWRWRGILEPVADVPFRSRFAAVCIGFMGNNLLPARLGEFMRAYSLSRMEPVPVVGSFASLLVERLFDGVLVIVLLFVAMSLPDFPSLTGFDGFSVPALARGMAILVGIMTVVLFSLVLFPQRAVALLERIIDVLPNWLLPDSFRRPMVDALEAFLAGASMLRDPRLLLRASSWSIVLWLFNALGFWIGMNAFGIHLSFTAALFLQSAVALAVSLPSAPGFFGTYQYAATLVLHDMWGADINAAGAFAIGFHLAGFIPVTLMGLFYAWRTGLTLGEVKSSEDIVEEAVERVTPTRARHRADGSDTGDMDRGPQGSGRSGPGESP
jgi:glycosyltransferase 2 family protein